MVFFSLGTTALEKMVMQNFGGINKVHYGLCNNDEGGRAKTIKKRNVWMQINFVKRRKNPLLQTKTNTCGRGVKHRLTLGKNQ